MAHSRHSFACIAALSALSVVSLSSVSADPLITLEEANLPDATVISTRGPIPGPTIEVISPPIGLGPIRSPLHLKVRFRSYGGAIIDLDTIRITYLKRPFIDLTPRLKSHIGPQGIELTTAEAPPGNHRIRIVVQDSKGRSGEADFTLKVAK